VNSETKRSQDTEALRVLEAVLFASSEPLSEPVLMAHLPDGADLPGMLGMLAEHYADRGVNLVEVANGWALRTAPDLASALRRETEVQRRLSRAALETLAIIAYHQPVTRAEIEQIRGVAVSRGTLDILFEQNWIQPRGRRRTPGRPATWVTTSVFLDHFGLAALDDLPGVDELRAAGLLDSEPQQAALDLRLINPDELADDRDTDDRAEIPDEPLDADEEPFDADEEPQATELKAEPA
jgi:segregation and condensation protein B